MKRKLNFFPLLGISLALSLIFGPGTALYAQDLPITSASDEAKALFVKGRNLFDNLRNSEARTTFDKCLNEDPDFALCNLYRALSSPTDEEFTRHLAKAISKKSEVSNGERLLIDAVKANSERKPEQAIALLSEAISEYPNDKRLHHWLGLAYMGGDNTNQAMAEFNRAIEIDPNFAPSYNNLGYLYRDKGDFAAAEQAFKNYIRLLPDEANPHDSIGDLYTKMGKYDLAIEYYNKALELNPSFFFSQQKIGDNLVFKGQYEEGRKAYQKAIALAPTASDKIALHQQMAETYLYEDNPQMAGKEYLAAIRWAEQEKLPEIATTLYQRKALMELEQGNATAAKSDMEASDELAASSMLTENRKNRLWMLSQENKALLAAQEGDFDKASAKATKIYEQASQVNNPADMKAFHMISGIIAYRQGDFAKAIEHLKQSEVNNPMAQYYLALSYQRNDDPDMANSLYTKVANWNENSLEYALVRNKARSATKIATVDN